MNKKLIDEVDRTSSSSNLPPYTDKLSRKLGEEKNNRIRYFLHFKNDNGIVHPKWLLYMIPLSIGIILIALVLFCILCLPLNQINPFYKETQTSTNVINSGYYWCMSGNDSQNTRYSRIKGPLTNKLKWRYKTKSGFWLQNPAVGADGTVYIGYSTNKLLAINPNGRLKWVFNAHDYINNTPALGADGTIYCTNNYKLFAITPKGRLKWRINLGYYCLTSPLVAKDGTIYLGSFNATLHAINPNGIIKWKYIAEGPSVSMPAIGLDGSVLFGCGDLRLYALNPNGELKWRFRSQSPILAPPAVGQDGSIYFVNSGNYLYSLKSNGDFNWKIKGRWLFDVPPIIGVDGSVYAFGDGIYAVSSTGKIKNVIFAHNCEIATHTPLITKDNIIYATGDDGDLSAVHVDNKLVWQFYADQRNDYGTAPAIGPDGTIYYGKLYGDLIAIGPGEGR